MFSYPSLFLFSFQAPPERSARPSGVGVFSGLSAENRWIWMLFSVSFELLFLVPFFGVSLDITL